ncbi:MAG: hypothetical protein K6A29_02835 [Lachnospiraceae bacterium]|nr:hypothetical protein [Lachnospiraceae bacterium]
MGVVRIRRNPTDYRIAEVSSFSLTNAHWSNVCGGLQVPMPVTNVYCYIDYDVAAESEIACSGTHSYGYNKAKVCLCKCDNTGKGNEKYEESYYRLVVEADNNTHSHRMNRKYTKTVLDLLNAHPEGLARKTVMHILEELRYDSRAIRNAIRIINKAGLLRIDGSPTGKNSVLSIRKL